MTTQLIAIDLFDGAEELDVVGPWEVLAFWTQTFPQDGWRCELVSDDGESRTCAKGLTLTPTASWNDLPTPALLVQPGGDGTRVRARETAHVARVQHIAGSSGLVTSVCTGTRVLAVAGLLGGRPATTHHYRYDDLLQYDLSIELRKGERFVDDGDIVTSAGVSAGIDMALHLIGRLVSPERARDVQSGIEYYPAPPTWDAA